MYKLQGVLDLRKEVKNINYQEQVDVVLQLNDFKKIEFYASELSVR